jgi:hypothetical protein
MTHLLERPRSGWLVFFLNVQDTSHPADYTLLEILCLSAEGVSRRLLLQKFEQVQHEEGIDRPSHERLRAFNDLMKHLENDFYIVETADGHYDFASGLLKAWWRKYYV